MNKELEQVVEACDNIDADIWECIGQEDEYPQFEITMTTMCGLYVKFLGESIWYSDADMREWIEDEDDYEPIEPYLRKKINEKIEFIKKIKV